MFLVVFVYYFNLITKEKFEVKERWNKVNLLLKYRHNEILKLIKLTTTYFGEENERIKNITELQRATLTETDLERVIYAEKKLLISLSKLLLAIENDILAKEDEKIQKILAQFEPMENKISQARINYNYKVRVHNKNLEKFPFSIIAKIFNYKKEKEFHLVKGV